MNNPIIQREFIGLLRTWRAFFIMLGLAAALAALVVLRWPPDAQSTHGQAQQVLRLFGYGLMVGLIFLAPVFPATSVVKEKLSGTLALLLNSPLTPADILMGKLIGVVGYITLLLVISLPAAVACHAMGGVDLLNQLALIYLVLALLSLQYATLGLWISTITASTDSALRITYGIILLLAVLPLAPQMFLQGQAEGPLALGADWLRCLSPIPAMMSVLGHGSATAAGIVAIGYVALRYALLAVLSIAFFIFLTLRRLNSRLFDTPRDAGRVTDERSTGVQIFRRIMFLWFFDPQRRSGLIGPFTNPVMVKEFRSGRFSRSHWMMRLLAVTFVGSLALTLATTQSSYNWGPDKVASMMVPLTVALIVLITPSLASGLISVERESRGWQLLQMTPLSAFSIITGKLLSVLRTLSLVLLATLPGYGVMIAISKDQTYPVLKVLLTMLLTAFFALFFSAAMSSVFKRTAPATAASYSFLLALCAGTMLPWLDPEGSFTPHTVAVLFRLNPIAAALSAIRDHPFAHYALIPDNWYLLAAGSVASLLLLLVRTWQLTRPQ